MSEENVDKLVCIMAFNKEIKRREWNIKNASDDMTLEHETKILEALKNAKRRVCNG